MEFENENTLIWYDKSNWHAGQTLGLQMLWNTDFEIFATTLIFHNNFNFNKVLIIHVW